MLVENARIYLGEMQQLVATVAVCQLAILKRMPATPQTLLVANQVWEQVKVQVQRSGKMKTWGVLPNPKGKYTEFSNSILSKFYMSFWTTSLYKEWFCHCFVTERKH